MQKIQDNRAWLLVLPVFVTVAFSAIIPLIQIARKATTQTIVKITTSALIVMLNTWR